MLPIQKCHVRIRKHLESHILEKNAITATVTGLRLSRIKHWNPLASNPGYPFQILSRSFGEKSCLPFRICLTTLEKNRAFHFGFCLTTLEKNCAFHSGFCLIALEGKKTKQFFSKSENPKWKAWIRGWESPVLVPFILFKVTIKHSPANVSKSTKCTYHPLSG